MKICPACQASYADAIGTCSRDGSALIGGILEPGAVLRNKYRIQAVVGLGGMAVVYHARHLLWNEDCALKVLHRPGGSGFLAEAQILRRLRHPHIVRVEDAEIAEDDRPFVAMEFIEGESLRDRLRRSGPIHPEEALRITAETCSALEAAHVAGIIHRDIKPHNILLARGAAGQERVKVIDFGIAKVKEDAGFGFTGVMAGTTGYFVGTLDYASPEQALGLPSSELDRRTDLYSLGLVLYEMLTGAPPFRGETPMATLLQRLQTAPASPQQIKPDLPRSACDVVMHALERERAARYSSAAEMGRACEDSLSTIRRDREEAIRRDEEARTKRMAAEQAREGRREQYRRAAERLRWALRVPAVLVRRLLAHRTLSVAAAVLGGLALLALGVYTYFYAKYAPLVDQRLREGFFANPTKIFAAPESVAVGDALSPADIASQLRRSGYTESHANRTGYYQTHPNSIEIFPGPDSYFEQEAGVIKFAGGKISQIVSPQDNISRPEYQLEPQLITNAASANREKRRIVRFRDTPPVLVQAVTSAEDKRFFQHAGFDPLGGPTITEKLVDLLWNPNGRWSRLMITLQLEQKLSKEEIFEDYCNQIYLGSRGDFRIRGIGEAAAAFLGKDLNQINLPEAAELAGMIRRPEDSDPFRHPDVLKERRNEVLGLMRQNGYIGDRDYAFAIEAPVAVAQGTAQSLEAPYFVDVVDDALQAMFQGADFESNSFRVYTGLDMRLQRAAAEAIRLGMASVDEQIKKQDRFKGETPPEPQVALVAIDPHTGAVRALAGGRNYGMSQLDRVLAQRQPGAIFKPFVYAAAMDTAVEGGPRILTPSTTVIDRPTTFWYDGKSYEPPNFGKKYLGEVTLRDALAHSLNVATVKVAEMVGYDHVVAMAERANMHYRLQPTPSVALGSYEITPLEAAAAYTIFANGGAYVKPSFISLVRSQDGKSIYNDKPETKQALDPRVAYLMTNLMEEVPRTGANGDIRAKYNLSSPMAGMTGASHDGWFAGYTSELLCVVWVGFEDNRELDLEGAHSAAPIWAEFMKRALDYREYGDTKPFAAPDGIVTMEIDPLSGMLATRSCPTHRPEVYIAGTQPVSVCPRHGGGRPITTTVTGWVTPALSPPAAVARRAVRQDPKKDEKTTTTKEDLQRRLKGVFK